MLACTSHVANFALELEAICRCPLTTITLDKISVVLQGQATLDSLDILTVVVHYVNQFAAAFAFCVFSACKTLLFSVKHLIN